MNVIFGAVLCVSTALLIINDPEKVLAAFLSGGAKALSLTAKMLVIYAVLLCVFSIILNTPSHTT